MTKLAKIEAAVSSLSPEELAKFRAWFEELDAHAWDAEIERDAKTGQLDGLGEKALLDHKAGRTKAL
ncbi:hypothetical protein V3H18_03395 [Methylocystis sp. 9N]|uniref:Uncharacterized protein n=1 Tax=Methylocystis borbori TaxID=3118750 RepID=A0ABU7XGA0_9HYPH